MSTLSNVYGNHDILTDMKTGNAKVAVFGDSISNNTATSFGTFFQAALLTWHPDSWKGAWFNTQGSVGQAQTSTGFSTGPETVFPGEGGDNVAITLPGIDHCSASFIKGGQKSGTTGFIVSPNFRLNMLSSLQATRSNASFFTADWGDGPEAFVESSGSRTIATSGHPVVVGFRSVMPNFVNYNNAGMQYIFYNPGSSNNTGLQSDQVTVAGTASDGFKVEAVYTQTSPDSNNWDGDAAPAGQVWQAQWRHNGGSGYFCFDSSFFGKNADGMTLSYYGNGGWTLRSHLDGESLLVSGLTDEYHYSDNYLIARLRAEETTHAFIFLGENDISARGRTSSEAIADLDLLLARLRAAKTDIKIVILTIYNVADDTSEKETYKAEFNDYIKSLGNKYTCVIDLANYIYTQKTQAELEADWLFDGTHPNGPGALAMMGYVWDRVLASEAAGAWSQPGGPKTYEHVYGDESILLALKSSKAHVMFVGDSICNDGAGTFVSWPQGFAQYARPNNWESIYIVQGGNSEACGTQTTASGGASDSAADYNNACFPGDTSATVASTTGFLGWNPRTMGIQKISASYGVFGQTFRPYIEKDRVFATGTAGFIYLQDPIYTEASNNNPFDINNEYVFDVFVASRVDGTNASDGAGFITTARSKPYDNGASQLDYDVDYDLTTIDNSSGLHLYTLSSLPYTPTSIAGNDFEIQLAGNTTTGGWNSTAQWHGCMGGRMRRSGVNGLAVYYAGYGGWKSGNHRYEYGDPSVPNIGAGYAASYSNAGAAEWVKATDSNIFFIYIGQNDSWSGAGLTIADNIKAIVARYRTIASLAGVVDPKFIICQTSCVTDSTTTYDQMKISAAELAAWAPTQSDCVFLDLQSYLETRFDFSDVSASNQWKASYTIDGTHPNLAGMEVMASDFLWTKVLEVESNIYSGGSIGVNFTYDSVTNRFAQQELHLDEINNDQAGRWAKAVGSVSNSAPYTITGNSMYKKLLSIFKRVK